MNEIDDFNKIREYIKKWGHDLSGLRALNAMDKQYHRRSSCQGCGKVVSVMADRPISIEKGLDQPCTFAMHGGKPPEQRPTAARTGDLSQEVVFAMVAAERLANARNHNLLNWIVGVDPVKRLNTFVATCQRCHQIITIRVDGKIDSQLGTDPCIGPNHKSKVR